MLEAVVTSDTGCHHCGLPLPTRQTYPVIIDGESHLMCCPGCQAVASAIVAGGLSQFYQYRSEVNTRPEVITQKRWQVYDLPDVQQDFVFSVGGNCKRATLIIEGITCAACAWLIESHLKACQGVVAVRINLTTHRCTLEWDATETLLSTLFSEFEAIGYKPLPATDEQEHTLMLKEYKLAMLRLGVAGFGMMQAGMVSVGLYTGATDFWLDTLRVLSLLLSTPVVFFSAQPFFRAAINSLKLRKLIMDVPVALAIAIGYSASVWATFTRSGDVYFESVTMLIFFLLVGRYLEMRARNKYRAGTLSIAQLMPPTATIAKEEGWEDFPVQAVKLGDKVLVRAGDSFPADGIVLTGKSQVNEALLTGESTLVHKSDGDDVIAGSQNCGSSLEVEVTAIGGATQLSAIETLIENAEKNKPKQVLLADLIARKFVASILIICMLVFVYWQYVLPARALWITLSVLVVTCPCALALAMPVAFTAAIDNLRRMGILLTKSSVFETLPQITRIIFDKTGTLTQGNLRVEKVIALGDMTEQMILNIAAALERHTHHPIASAFQAYDTAFLVDEAMQVIGGGVSGGINNERYYLGSVDFVTTELLDKNEIIVPDDEHLWLILADSKTVIGFIGLSDTIRPEAFAIISEMKSMGIKVELLSGDSSQVVYQVARKLNIDTVQAGASPSDKLLHLQNLQNSGEIVMMVGDGINDVPVLSQADVSVAMAKATGLAQTHADCLLLKDTLQPLVTLFKKTKTTRRIIRQNLLFSLLYNVIALPIAAMGLIPPWAAALGMSASSLIVVLNALRLTREHKR